MKQEETYKYMANALKHFLSVFTFSSENWTIHKLKCYVLTTLNISHDVNNMAFLLNSTNTQRIAALKIEKTVLDFYGPLPL